MKDLEQLILAIFGGIVTLAIVAVFVSKNGQGPQVIQSAASALGNVVSAAVQPLPASSNSATLSASPVPFSGLGNSAWSSFLGGH